MKPVQNGIYLRWLWYSFFSIFEMVSLATGLVHFKYNNILAMNKQIGRITSRSYSESTESQSQHYEIFCTIDWPVVIASRVANISINLEFDDDRGLSPSWPSVTRVNETTIRLCVDKMNPVFLSMKTYACYLTITKATLQNAHEKGAPGWSLKPGFDQRFQKECRNELSRVDSHFHYLLVNRSNSLSVCSEGLQRIQNNGYLQLLENLTSISEISGNDYEFLAIGFALGDLSEEYSIWNNSTGPLTCSRYMLENNTYSISKGFLNFKLVDRLRLTMTSSTIMLDWHTDGYLQQLLQNLTYEPVELSYRQNARWHLLPNQTVQLPENQVGVWDNPIEPNMNAHFRVRIKSMFGPHLQKYLSPYFEVTLSIDYSIPDTDIFLFHIDYPNEFYRTVTLYWRPMTSEHLPGVNEAFEIDEDGSKRHSSDVQSYWSNNFQAKYRVGSTACRFSIKSTVTEASDSSYIYVPSAKNKVNSNIFLYSRNYLNSTIDYIWQISKNQTNIVRFTFFWYWIDENSTSMKMDNVKMNWIHLPQDTTRHRLNFDTTKSKLFRSFLSITTKNSNSGLFAPRQTIFSISNHRKSGEHFQLNQEGKKQNYKKIETSRRADESENDNFKKTVDIGRKFSVTQYQKWLQKIVGDEF